MISEVVNLMHFNTGIPNLDKFDRTYCACATGYIILFNWIFQLNIFFLNFVCPWVTRSAHCIRHIQLKCLKMAEITTMNPNCTRVMLWCVPRTVSTSFLKCMTSVPNSQCWYEPYLMACYFSKYGKNRNYVLSQMQQKWGAEESLTADTFASEIEGKRSSLVHDHHTHSPPPSPSHTPPHAPPPVPNTTPTPIHGGLFYWLKDLFTLWISFMFPLQVWHQKEYL